MSRRSLLLLPTLLVLGLFGAFAGTTMAQLPPLPTVSVPTVTVPSVPVPPVPTPPAPPTPPVPAPPPVPVPLPPPPPVPVPTPTVPKVEVPPAPVDPGTAVPGAPNPAAGGSPGSGSGSGSPAAPGAPSGPGGPYPPLAGPSGGATPGFVGAASSRQVTIVGRIRTSRPWLVARRGSARPTRSVTISFWLSRAGTVIFLVDEVYPSCRYVGKFLVRGRRGLNVVRFTGRVRRRQLRPGTYRLNAYPRSQRQRRLTGVTVVILRNRAGRAAVGAAQERNVCPAGQSSSVRAALVARRNAGPSDRATGSVAGVRTTPERKRVPEEGGGLTGVPSAVGGAVGSAADTIEAAADAVPPALFALAALAVLLLAIASMPQPVRTSRAAAALVHHRGTIAIAGAGVLVAAIVSFALL